MYKIAKPFFMLCETPLHAGSGNDLGSVDLPIQRERHTQFPKVEGSGLKGSIREVFDKLSEVELNGGKVQNKELKQAIELAFGPENAGDYAGALGFTDTRILLFPVKSMKGVFAWITCPKVLNRLQADLSHCKINLDFEMPNVNTIPEGSALVIRDNKIVLEEYTFRTKTDENCSKLANWIKENVFPKEKEFAYLRENVNKNLAVLSDEDFTDFVIHSTEVVTRTKIDSNTGTVQSGALFTEEYLPTDTVLYSLGLTTPVFKKDDSEKGVFKAVAGKTEEVLVMEFFQKGLPKVIQLGGNATIGKGLIRTNVWGVE
jgi:CRISPR-associated protein Cmr4